MDQKTRFRMHSCYISLILCSEFSGEYLIFVNELNVSPTLLVASSGLRIMNTTLLYPEKRSLLGKTVNLRTGLMLNISSAVIQMLCLAFSFSLNLNWIYWIWYIFTFVSYLFPWKICGVRTYTKMTYPLKNYQPKKKKIRWNYTKFAYYLAYLKVNQLLHFSPPTVPLFVFIIETGICSSVLLP